LPTVLAAIANREGSMLWVECIDHWWHMMKECALNQTPRLPKTEEC